MTCPGNTILLSKRVFLILYRNIKVTPCFFGVPGLVGKPIIRRIYFSRVAKRQA